MTTKQALFQNKDYITTEEWADAEIETLLDVSGDLKRKFKTTFPIGTCRTRPSSSCSSTNRRARGIRSKRA